MTLPPQTDTAPYKARQLLSGGGQSSVWLAEGPTGAVALKTPRNASGRSILQAEARFLREFTLPGLVRLVDSDPDGRWMAVDLVDGLPIDEWSEGRSAHEIVQALVQVLHTLGELHGKGVVHGDLHPRNIMVDSTGAPVLIDLGTATWQGDAAKEFRGTLGYAAPEVLQGRPYGPTADLYGVGAILYRCLAGLHPFQSLDVSARAYLPLITLPIPPSNWRLSLSPSVEEATLTLLARDVERRPSTTVEAIALLENSLDGEAPPQPIVGMVEERDALFRELVRAADRENAVVVLYGPSGSGRRTLVNECRAAAPRLGMEIAEHDPAGAEPWAGRRRRWAPLFFVASGTRQDHIDLARSFLASEMPGLLIILSDRPIPALHPAACHVSPSPLDPSETARLAAQWRIPPDEAHALWERFEGHPGSLIPALRHRAARAIDTTRLRPETQQIHDLLRRQGPSALMAIAEELKISPYEVLDGSAPLLAREIARFSMDKRRLELCDPDTSHG